MLTLTLLVALPGAFAAPSAKRAKKTATKRVPLEVYPALEDGEMEEEIVQTTRIAMEPAPAMPQKRYARPMTLRKAAPAKTTTTTVTTRTTTTKSHKNPSAPAAIDSESLGIEAPVSAPMMSAAAPIRKFEEVPAEKQAQILKRMQLCEALLKVSGRAYDYRKMTTAQLEQELAAFQPGRNANSQSIAAESNPYDGESGEETTLPIIDPIFNPSLGD